MSESLTLAVVATPDHYADYARELFLSAEEHFHPCDRIEYLLIDASTRDWPDATMLRHRRLLEAMPATDYTILLDADMLFTAPVGAEILPAEGYGLIACYHPGYIGKPSEELPFETREWAACYVKPDRRRAYYCGAWFGGDTESLRLALTMTTARIDADLAEGRVPVWHDESAVNAVLSLTPPAVALSPAYCHPDNDAYYRSAVWAEDYPRLCVALDKPQSERGER